MVAKERERKGGVDVCQNLNFGRSTEHHVDANTSLDV